MRTETVYVGNCLFIVSEDGTVWRESGIRVPQYDLNGTAVVLRRWGNLYVKAYAVSDLIEAAMNGYTALPLEVEGKWRIKDGVLTKTTRKTLAAHSELPPSAGEKEWKSYYAYFTDTVTSSNAKGLRKKKKYKESRR
ncbi:MAG: hypothetical protein ACRDCE_18025 [Cetobacterium sp.]|uniref:hypothetical protein n=1 Tax=Cetobacterium sp. TaxID=2071632 RepID=UPI003EE71821